MKFSEDDEIQADNWDLSTFKDDNMAQCTKKSIF